MHVPDLGKEQYGAEHLSGYGWTAGDLAGPRLAES